MNDYAAYGLIIRSAFALPELVEASALEMASAPRPKGSADVTISLLPPGQANPSTGAWATHDSACIDYPGTASFLVRRGSEISIAIAPNADARLVRLYLLGPILALLLHQRQFLVLHSSAVNIGGRAVAFVGEKGMGKSTMAAAMYARGHALVADDLLAVDTRVSPPLVYPGFPQLKLFPESAALLGGDPQLLPRVHPDLEKRARKIIAPFQTAPLPLRRIFVLADADAEAVEPLAASRAFMELVRHSYLLAVLKVTGSAAMHFQQATALASAVPVARLLRRRSLEALPDVAQLVEAESARAEGDYAVCLQQSGAPDKDDSHTPAA